jgi:hypothetical protein
VIEHRRSGILGHPLSRVMTVSFPRASRGR